MSFEGANVLVTGGTRGIGLAIATRFAKLGAKRVAISYLRNDKAAEAAAEEIHALGAEPVLIRGNIGDPDNVVEMVETAGALDVLVSNAATGVIKPIAELTEKHWDWTMNANARALFTLARHAAPSMPEGSAIVAISSLGSDRVLDNYSLVGTSKAAIESIVRYLAVELAPQDIRVNAVSAGLVETGALDHFPDREGMLATFRERTPAGRLVDPEDVADAVAFLASDEAKMIRGQTIVLDGGYSVIA